MENASKALIIAAGALLMIMILSFAVYTFGRMAASASSMYSKIEDSDRSEFNQKFLNYKDRSIKADKSNAFKIQDIITITNFARENNNSEKMPVEVTVTLNGKGNIADYTDTQLNNLLASNLDKKYKCSGIAWNNELGLIKGITFEEI